MVFIALSLDISLNILHMSREIKDLVGGLYSISCCVLCMYFFTSIFIVLYIKDAPPLTPIAKLYGARNSVKSAVLCLTVRDVKDRLHTPPMAIGRNLLVSFGSF